MLIREENFEECKESRSPVVEAPEQSHKCNKYLLAVVIVFSLMIISSIIVTHTVFACNTGARSNANKQSGHISDHFKRVVVEPRIDYKKRVEALGLSFHDEPSIEWSQCEEEAYWNEEGIIQISAQAEQEIMEATWQMHNMCLQVVDRVVNDPKLLRLFNIHSDLWPAIRRSWKEKQFDLLGRFDWSWDGVNPPKLLEYNADTPSLLLESSAVQGEWFISKLRKFDDQQSNYI